MLSSMSPKKRKCCEYRDPDYATIWEPNSSGSTNVVKRRHYSLLPSFEVMEEGKRLHSMREIISSEFEREIFFKKQQLEQVHERLLQAKLHLNRLRYAIVTEYYEKQHILKADMAAVRGTQIFLEQQKHVGPQKPLHPSLKKIFGKGPCNYAEIMRSCPKRTAAQNARHTIKSTTHVQRRQERRIQQLIREQGIVIDHSKQTLKSNSVPLTMGPTEGLPALSNVHMRTSNATVVDVPSYNFHLQQSTAGKALNAARLNNKVKHLIVVGNTSKYICAENNDRSEDRKPFRQLLTHKWLVYIQSKDKDLPLEKFIRKIRFFLHPSYRPNDIVDISSPPFQLTRHGWGEFPVRMQLFFYEHLHQKPVQLVHNIVLDKTLSGMHSLGGETVVEVWLRSSELPSTSSNVDSKQKQQIKSTDALQKVKQRTISDNATKKELDDNLLEFINKLGETPTPISSDIERIEPTIVVAEPPTNVVKIISKIECESPINGNTQPLINISAGHFLAPKSKTSINKETRPVIPSNLLVKSNNSLPLAQKSSAAIKIEIINANNATSGLPKADLGNSDTRALLMTREGKLILSAVHLPNSGITTNGLQPTGFAVNDTSKRIFQDKLLKLMDATGKLKCLQILVATSVSRTVVCNSSKREPTVTVAANLANSSTNSTPSTETAISSIVSNCNFEKKVVKNFKLPAVTDSYPVRAPMTAIKKDVLGMLPKSTNKSPKNVVFQKEGKLYIIDSLQMKFKQQQKKQVSLLKPQLSLLKPPQHNTHSVVSDHNYVPPPGLHESTTQFAGAGKISEHEITLRVPSQKRLTTNSTRELLQIQATKFERNFNKYRVINMRLAVESLLRRLPLIANHDATWAIAFPFVQDSLQEFQTLTAIKQRACEWLRAKCISRMLRNHKDLQQLKTMTRDMFWSTKEIVIFARLHAYTPNLKALPQLKRETQPLQFTQLVKPEVENEQLELHCDTLTAQTHIASWVESKWHNLQQLEDLAEEKNTINVDSFPTQYDASQPKRTHEFIQHVIQDLPDAEVAYMPIVKRLEHETRLVSQICKGMFVQLESQEQIGVNAVHPLAQTLLAQSLHIFVEKLLRKVVAFKLQQQRTPSGGDNKLTLYTRDVGKAVARTAEFDFLTNSNFGSSKLED